MNHVERFQAVMNFQPVDRLPAGIVELRFGVTHAGLAIVTHEDKDGILFQTQFLQSTPQASEILIDVGDHSQKARVLLTVGVDCVDMVDEVSQG